MALTVSIDSIVRSVLLKEGRSLHWYIQYLACALAGLKKIRCNTDGIISCVELPVNDYKAAELPVDYLDWVKVGIKAGEKICPLICDKTLNPLNNYDSNNNKIPYPVEEGRIEKSDYRFCVIKVRDEIQLSADYPYKTVVLQYISDGLQGDAASEVNPLAQDCIEKYIIWQKSIYSTGISEGERSQAERRYILAFKEFRSSVNSLTREEIIEAVRSGYSPFPKI